MKNFETEFIFETFDEAIDIHKQLFKLLREHGFISYIALYTFVHKYTPEDIDYYRQYGWNSIYGVKVEPYGIDGEWVLKMPKVEKINKKENR